MFPDPKDQMVVTLVDQCLRLGPRNRISAKEALNHAFFAQTEIQARETKTNSEPTARPSGESSTKPAPVVEPPKTKDVPQASVGTSKVISRPGSMAVNPKRTVGGVRNGVPLQRAVSPRVRTRAASPALGRIVRPNEARTAKQGSSLSARSVSPRQPVRAGRFPASLTRVLLTSFIFYVLLLREPRPERARRGETSIMLLVLRCVIGCVARGGTAGDLRLQSR